MKMQEYLIDAGFTLVFVSENKIVVQDPRHKNYRVYLAAEDPSEFSNAWIEASKVIFQRMSEAIRYAGI